MLYYSTIFQLFCLKFVYKSLRHLFPTFYLVWRVFGVFNWTELLFSALNEFWSLQLTSLLADVGLNIQEAHAFSTTDGYSLDVFVVDGWPYEVYFIYEYH